MRNVIEQSDEFTAESDMQALGICADCIDRALCTGRRNWRGPVFFCEEYCNQRAVATSKAVLRPVVAASAEPSAAQVELKGLCINCERRDDCMFTKPEGGVWHCEEYE